MTAVVSRSIPPQPLTDLVNPLVRMVLRSPLHRALDHALLLLHVTGRRTGRRYDIPVGYFDHDGRLTVITQHAWRANVRAGADIEVTFRGRRRRMRPELDEDPASVAAVFCQVIEHRDRRAAQRQLTIKIDPGRTPTLAELETAVREYNLAIITLTPR